MSRTQSISIVNQTEESYLWQMFMFLCSNRNRDEVKLLSQWLTASSLTSAPLTAPPPKC